MKMSSSFPKVKTWFLDLVFPKFCVGCKKEGSWLCDKCEKNIIPVISQVCPQCGRLCLAGFYCRLCRFEVFLIKVKGKKKPKKLKRRKPLEGIISSLYYEEGPTKEIIHNIKYNSVTELVPVLGKAMAQALKSNFSQKDALITFAPLHPKRLAQRGFNQAELLAKVIAKESKLNLSHLLKKKKNTKRQVELKGNRRRKNLKDVFSFRGGDIKGKTIIIVDDVTTTGATLNECAKVLKAAGAKEVWGLVVARG